MTGLYLTDYPDNVLPLPQLRSHSLKPVDGVIRNKMVSGHIRNRRRFINTPTEMPVTWLFTGDQLELFRGWYYNILNGGARQFRMRVKHGAQVTLRDCKFLKAPGESAISNHRWKVTATLLVESIPVISADETLSAIYGGGSIIQATHDAVDAALTDYVTPDN